MNEGGNSEKRGFGGGEGGLHLLGPNQAFLGTLGTLQSIGEQSKELGSILDELPVVVDEP